MRIAKNRVGIENQMRDDMVNLSLGEVTALLTSKQSYRRTERGAEGVEETARPDDLEQQIASRTEAFVRDIIALIRR
jgi:hypothetical protein